MGLREGEVSRIGAVDGSKMEAIKTKRFPSTYGSAMSCKNLTSVVEHARVSVIYDP